MRLNAIFQALEAVVTISFGLVVAAPTGRYDDALSKRTTTYECDTSTLATLDYSWGEMIEMLSTAIDRTTSLITFLNNPPADVTSTGQLLQSTFNTFEAIYGKLQYGAGNSANADGLARVQKILNLATTIKNELQLISSNNYLEIYCNDYWLISTSPDGTLDQTNPYLYWDNRDTRSGNLAIDFTKSAGICRDSMATHYAWVQPSMSSSQTVLGTTTVLTLCPGPLSKWVSAYQAGETMTSYKTAVWPSSRKVNLNNFQGGPMGTLSTALMHELTHAPALLGSNYLNDGSCEVDGGTGSAYGWFCITQLAANAPSNAVMNADSFSFYVTAMFLSNYDWSTGLPVLMLTDTSPWYEDGLAELMSHVTLD